jgi:hypothetical protein
MLRWKDWIKSMYIKYVIYIVSIAIGLHVCGSWGIIKQKKNEKIMQCPTIKSFLLSYGSGFSLKRYYYAFIAQKWKFFFE